MITKLLNHPTAWQAAGGIVLAFSMSSSTAAQSSSSTLVPSAIRPAPRPSPVGDWKPTDGYPGIPFLSSAFAVTSWDPDGNGPLAPRWSRPADSITSRIAS